MLQGAVLSTQDVTGIIPAASGCDWEIKLSIRMLHKDLLLSKGVAGRIHSNTECGRESKLGSGCHIETYC